MINIHEPNISKKDLGYVKKCLESGWVSTSGIYIEKFEKNIAKFTNSKFAVACINGTAALQISLQLADVNPGDEVIVPSLTFIASVNAIKYNLAEPIFMDNDNYYTLDMNKVLEFLQNEVEKKDPLFYKEVDKNNPQRLLRALEVMYATNKTFSSFRKKEDKKRNFNIIKIGLENDRELLYNRINSRVDRMMKNGLLKEVESLINFKNKNSLQTVGYKEIFEYLEGESSIDEAISKIKQNSRRFAKRQITWFRKDTSIKYFTPKSLEEIIKFIG